MHGLHVLGDVEPTVSEVVERLYGQDVADEGVERTLFDEGIVSEEHAGEDYLKGDLGPHVQNDADHVVFLLSGELLLGEFVVVVVLVDEEIV